MFWWYRWWCPWHHSYEWWRHQKSIVKLLPGKVIQYARTGSDTWLLWEYSFKATWLTPRSGLDELKKKLLLSVHSVNKSIDNSVALERVVRYIVHYLNCKYRTYSDRKSVLKSFKSYIFLPFCLFHRQDDNEFTAVSVLSGHYFKPTVKDEEPDRVNRYPAMKTC